MQIRLTVLGPLRESPAGRPAQSDVLVTAPAGTALGAVASDLAAAVGAERSASSVGQLVLYAGEERLDPRRCTLGEPPLLDGAVLSVGAPTDGAGPGHDSEAVAQLRVVAGPDAGGVHLLHGGQIRVGRSAEADVPLDDPDVSRLHCAVTVTPGGDVTLTDLGSTNGTTIDGVPVPTHPVRLPAGALLRLGESALRLTPAPAEPPAALPTAPDGEGHVKVRVEAGTAEADGGAERPDARPPSGPGGTGHGPGSGPVPGSGDFARGADGRPRQGAPGASDGFGGGFGGGADGAARAPGAAGTGHGAPGAPARGAGGAWGAGGGFADGASRGSGGTDGFGAAAGAGVRRGSPAEGTHHGYGSAAWGAAGGPVDTGEADPGSAYGHEGGRGANGSSRNAGGTGPARDASGPWDPAWPAEGTHAENLPDEALRRVRGERRPDDGWGADSWADTRERDAPQGPGWAQEGPGEAFEGTFEDPGAPEAPGAARDQGPAGQGAGGARRRGGFSAWARRLAGGRTGEAYGEPEATGAETSGSGLRHGYGTYGGLSAETRPGTAGRAGRAAAGAQAPVAAADETWPDPATLLLTALGPGARLWERGPRHPEALTVRLGTADRPAQGGGVLPAVPVTAALPEVGSLGLAGPRRRLSGLVRSVLAQLAALHSPDVLEIVFIGTDRRRPAEERAAEWTWLGWLPHLRPGSGQACRLLVAYDRDQATARTDELLHRLAEHEAHRPGAGTGGAAHVAGSTTAPAGLADGASAAQGAHHAGGTGGHDFRAGPGDGGAAGMSGDHGGFGGSGGTGHGAVHPAAGHPAPAPGGLPGTASPAAGPAAGHTAGPYTVVVVDGDPGTPEVREAVARLAESGPGAGIHVICLAETPAVSTAAPVAATYEAACEAVPVFRSCGAVALLSGDVATELRLLRAVRGRLAGPGAVAAVDAVSLPWAERFARALAPLRPEGGSGGAQAHASAPLPQAARLLDELGLARATPASLLARWATAAEDRQAAGGRATAVLGAGTGGPVSVDLVADGPHMLVEGSAGSGRTELLRAVAASLAAAERPERLALVLIDGCDGLRAAGAGSGPGTLRGARPSAGEGLRICLDLPHAVSHLAVHDPVRMREFAQSLTAELKRRAEVLGRMDFAEWHSRGLSPVRAPARAAREGAVARGSEEGLSSARTARESLASTRTAQEGGSSARVGQHGVAAARGSREDVAAAVGEQGGGAGAGARAARGVDARGMDPRGVEVESPSATLHLRAGTVRSEPGPGPGPGVLPLPGPELPRLVVLVDDLDALLAPPLGSPGRPAAGSVVRALDAVAREGARLGVHLVAAGLPGGRVTDSEPGRAAALRVTLDVPSGGADDPAPGRGRVSGPDGRSTGFQGGRVTGRIPRTGTLRPTVVPLEWQRMGDPPARRSVRELGNGPTDLALLASALERAARAEGRGGGS